MIMGPGVGYLSLYDGNDSDGSVLKLISSRIFGSEDALTTVLQAQLD